MSEISAVDGTADPGSVSRLIPDLRREGLAAAGPLWRHFYASLVAVAARRLNDALHAAVGPDDVAQEALLELCRALAGPDSERRFPRLRDRRDLWRLLVCLTSRRAADVKLKYGRRVAVVAGESAAGEAGLAASPAPEAAPEYALAVEEMLAMLPDDSLRRVALLRLEGYSNEQIAERIGRSVVTVEVKFKAIRAVWKERLGID